MAKARYEDRQQRKTAEREAQEQRSRRRTRLWLGVGIAALAIAAAIAYSYYSKGQQLKAVTTTTYRAGVHVAGPIKYTESPPMGGAHNVAWQNCAVYDSPIHDEHAVHSLEHGAIWITYRPGLPSEQVERLRELAADDFMLVSPYPGLTHAVVASAWNHQLTFDRADDPALPVFIAEYKNNPQTTPEFGASCSGGTSVLATADSLTPGSGVMVR